MDAETKGTIDLSYLEATFGGNGAIVNKVLQSFIDNTPQLLRELIDNSSNKNWGEVKMVAHKMKSSYNTIGAKNTGEILAKIELEALGEDQLNISNLVAQVEGLSQGVFKEVKSELNK